MANDEDMDDIVEVIQEDTDNAKEFTDGIIYTTSLLLLGGIFTVIYALGSHFNIGMFADK